MQIRKITEGRERIEASVLSAYAFHVRVDDMEKFRADSLKQTFQDWGAFDDSGALMAHIINNQYTSRLDGHSVRNGGIGGVSTYPEYRVSGAVKNIFRALLPAAYADGEVISTLYPFSHAFYRKAGYETVCVKNVYTLKPEVLRDYRFTGEAVLWKDGDPVEEYLSLYTRFTDGLNLAIERTPEMMLEGRMKAEFLKDRRFSYLLKENGKAVAYVIFQDTYRPESALLLVKDLAWDGRAGFLAILGFLARFSADYGDIELPLPTGTELLSLLHSAKHYDVEKSSVFSYMIRAVNARKLLSLIRKPEGAAFTVRVSDDIIPENNGTFAVRGEEAVPTDASPDLDVSIQALGQLCCGAVSLSEAELREDVTVLSNRSSLAAVFTRKPLWISDHF